MEISSPTRVSPMLLFTEVRIYAAFMDLLDYYPPLFSAPEASLSCISFAESEEVFIVSRWSSRFLVLRGLAVLGPFSTTFVRLCDRLKLLVKPINMLTKSQCKKVQ